jgi:Coenzyme PQQ synthesis protein D (PqqD)
VSAVRFEPTEDVIFESLQDEIVLLDMNSQQYFSLDDVGSDMWKLLLQHGDINTVTDCLCAEYDVDRATVRKDLEALIENLVGRGLLKSSGPGPDVEC